MKEFKFTNHNLDVVSILTDEDRDLEITKFDFTEYFEELTAAVEIRLKKNFSTREFVENGYISIVFEDKETEAVQVKNFRIYDIKETETEIELTAFWHNLEMLNEILPPYKNQPQRTLVQHMEAMGIIPYPQFKLLENEETSRQMTIEYEGEGTKLKRLVSLLNTYDCEGQFKELDSDGEVLGLAIYKKGNSDRRVGQNRPDVDISGLLKVEANYNIEEVYNAIRPTGEEGIVIPAGRSKYYYDDDGRINFELKNGAIYSRSSINAFPATLGNDKIVMAYKEINTSSVDKLESEALKMLKLHHMPKITLTVSTESTADFVDLEIGDTVSFNLENFFLFRGTTTARVEKKVSDFINDTATYELSNFSKFTELATNNPTQKIVDEYDLTVELSDPDFSEADLVARTAEQTFTIRGWVNGKEAPIESIKVYTQPFQYKPPELFGESSKFTYTFKSRTSSSRSTVHFSENFLFVVRMSGVEIQRRWSCSHESSYQPIKDEEGTELREIVIAENYSINNIDDKPRVEVPEILIEYDRTEIKYTMTSDCADYFYLVNANNIALPRGVDNKHFTTSGNTQNTFLYPGNARYIRFERSSTKRTKTSGTVTLKFYVPVYKDGTIPVTISKTPLTVEKISSINSASVRASYGYFSDLNAGGSFTARRGVFSSWLETDDFSARKGVFTGGILQLGNSNIHLYNNNFVFGAPNGNTVAERLDNGSVKIGVNSLTNYYDSFQYNMPYGIKATIILQNEFCTITFWNNWVKLGKGVGLKMAETLPEGARPKRNVAMPINGNYVPGSKSVTASFIIYTDGEIYLTCPDDTLLHWSGTVTYPRKF